MKKLFSYLLISSMVVLSSCTNYDDQFDDLNTQINTLKSQIEGFSSLSSGLTALQGTVASLQSAIANIPVTPATDISGLESTQAALQTALTDLAAEVTKLQDSLATAATAAEVAALQTALTNVQSDLTELLASNNVYSDDLVITSAATLEVAKSLGGKLAILNADLYINQTAAMSSADLQSVLDVMVTTTGNIIYTAENKDVVAANFSKLTSATGIYLDVPGAISFPLLENVTTFNVMNTYDTYITSLSLPALTSVTNFIDGGTYTYTSPSLATTTAGTSDQIGLAKATSVDLGAIATYDASALTITSKAKSTLDLAALTSKKKDGTNASFALVVSGAAELDLPLFTKGSIVADNTQTIDLPLYIGSSSDSFAAAESVTLGAYTVSFNTGANVQTLDITMALPANATATTARGDVTVDSNVIETITLAGTMGDVTIDSGASNKSLTSVSLTGKARDVSVDNMDALETLVLGHTAEKATASYLSVTNNDALTALHADSLASANSLTITGNAVLAEISFDNLATLGSASSAAANVDVSDNALVATSSSEILTTATTANPQGTGTFTTASGMDDLDTYLAAAATRYATSGGTVYASFDTLDEYLNADGVDQLTQPITWTSKGGNNKLEVVYLDAGDFVAAITAGGTKAKRSFVVDLSTADAAFRIDANGAIVDAVGSPGTNAALAALSIASEANVATANALGVAMSAAATARGTATITLGAIGSSENSPTTAAAIAQLSEGFLKSNTLVLNIDGNSYTYSTTSASVTAAAAASAIVTGFNAKFSGNLAEYTLGDGGAGSISVTSADIGSDGVAKSIAITVAAGGASATNVGYKINTASTNDNNTLASTSAVLVTFEASSTGSDLSEIGYPTKAMSTSAKSVKISVTVGTSTVTELSSTAFSNSNTASGVETATNKYPTESRNDVRNPHDGATLRAQSGSKINTNKISWI